MNKLKYSKTVNTLFFTPSKFLFIGFISLFFIFQSCSKNDNPIVVNPPSSFQTPNIEDVVMYEINPAAFSTTKNFQGITNRLDDIKALGINTIWIMPIYPVGVLKSFGSPYCVKDYTAVNPSLGTLQELKTLVTKAHEKNIAVLLDWVGNHTSWDNTWITNKSWYTQDANGNIISPAGTNWNDVADLNYNNSDMRIAMIAAMKYWVENANIDGYRCDAADFIPFDFWQQAINSLRKIPGKNLIMLAEGNRADHFNAGFQLDFSWDYLSTLKNVFTANQNVSTLFSTNANEYLSVPNGKQKLRFTTNHDESNQATPITVFGGKNGALAASAITIFMQGVPLIYCGQEVGVSNTSTYNGSATINWNTNGDMLSEYTKMLTFYNSSNAARKGILTTFSDTNIAFFEKKLGAETILVITNTRATTQTLSVPAVLQGNWNNAFTNSAVSLSNNLSLSPYQYLILKN